MVADALKRNPAIDTPEALFEEVYRGEMSGGVAEPSTCPSDEKGSA
jgi:hypothetical protein